MADVRDITRAILLSPVFEELDKRSLLAAIIKLYPEVQGMVVGTEKTAAPEAKLVVSWTSLKRREAELEDLDRNQIPKTARTLESRAVTAICGRITSSRRRRKCKTILARRKAELEQMLARAEGNDFVNADTSKVTLGTKVTL